MVSNIEDDFSELMNTLDEEVKKVILSKINSLEDSLEKIKKDKEVTEKELIRQISILKHVFSNLQSIQTSVSNCEIIAKTIQVVVKEERQ